MPIVIANNNLSIHTIQDPHSIQSILDSVLDNVEEVLVLDTDGIDPRNVRIEGSHNIAIIGGYIERDMLKEYLENRNKVTYVKSFATDNYAYELALITYIIYSSHRGVHPIQTMLRIPKDSISILSYILKKIWESIHMFDNYVLLTPSVIAYSYRKALKELNLYSELESTHIFIDQYGRVNQRISLKLYNSKLEFLKTISIDLQGTEICLDIPCTDDKGTIYVQRLCGFIDLNTLTICVAGICIPSKEVDYSVLKRFFDAITID